MLYGEFVGGARGDVDGMRGVAVVERCDDATLEEERAEGAEGAGEEMLGGNEGEEESTHVDRGVEGSVRGEGCGSGLVAAGRPCNECEVEGEVVSTVEEASRFSSTSPVTSFGCEAPILSRVLPSTGSLDTVAGTTTAGAAKDVDRVIAGSGMTSLPMRTSEENFGRLGRGVQSIALSFARTGAFGGSGSARWQLDDGKALSELRENLRTSSETEGEGGIARGGRACGCGGGERPSLQSELGWNSQHHHLPRAPLDMTPQALQNTPCAGLPTGLEAATIPPIRGPSRSFLLLCRANSPP